GQVRGYPEGIIILSSLAVGQAERLIGSGQTLEHPGAVKHDRRLTRVSEALEPVGRHVVTVRPHPELGVVITWARACSSQWEVVTVIRGRGVGRLRAGNALCPGARGYVPAVA